MAEGIIAPPVVVLTGMGVGGSVTDPLMAPEAMFPKSRSAVFEMAMGVMMVAMVPAPALAETEMPAC
jgi:hypothetical protein